jgi:site-specific recombinase XerD
VPAQSKDERARLNRIRGQARYRAEDADLVIRTPAGGPVSKAVDNTMWHQACDGAGVSSVGRDVHAARHTAATTMVAAGVPLTTVQAVLGHSTIAVTQRYVTTTAVAQDVALDAVAAYLARQAG